MFLISLYLGKQLYTCWFSPGLEAEALQAYVYILSGFIQVLDKSSNLQVYTSASEPLEPHPL